MKKETLGELSANEETQVLMPTYCDIVVTDISTNPIRSDIRERIKRLRVDEKLPADEIVRKVNGDLQLREGIGQKTARRIITRICEQIIPDETRKEIHAALHARVMSANIDAVQKGRRKWMKENNMFVWSDEQTEYFKDLLKSEEFQRPQWRVTTRRLKKTQTERKRRMHYNHEAIAEAMNKRFGTKEFDSERSRRKLERIREDEKRGKSMPDENPTEDVQTPTKNIYIDLPEDFVLTSYIRWLYLQTELKMIELNIHELRRALSQIRTVIHERDWVELEENIRESISTYSPSLQQFFYYVLAECRALEGETIQASKFLEFGLRSEGILGSKLNERLKQLSNQEPAERGKIWKQKRLLK